MYMYYRYHAPPKCNALVNLVPVSFLALFANGKWKLNGTDLPVTAWKQVNSRHCDFASIQAGNLRTHLKTHDVILNFVCPSLSTTNQMSWYKNTERIAIAVPGQNWVFSDLGLNWILKWEFNSIPILMLAIEGVKWDCCLLTNKCMINLWIIYLLF